MLYNVLLTTAYYLFLSYSLVVNCFSPPPLRNGSVSVTTTTVKSVATYYCKEGFELVGGNPQITCQINGKWSDNQLNCIGKERRGERRMEGRGNW